VITISDIFMYDENKFTTNESCMLLWHQDAPMGETFMLQREKRGVEDRVGTVQMATNDPS
jgi:hypothetical protein